MPPRERAPNGEGKRRYRVFPARLAAKLKRIPDYPVTLIEAPSGFGKTTAVREFLKTLGARIYWHTCLGEPPSKTWQAVCRMFGMIDSDAARNMEALYPLSRETAADVAAIMDELRCEEETFLVIDNYHMFGCEARREVAGAFSFHDNPKPHVVFIVQSLGSASCGVCGENVHRLAAGDFLFDRDSAARFCRSEGIKLSERELARLDGSAGGWIAAIRLQIENYRETGAFLETGDKNEMIEAAVWNRLSDEERRFLLALSPLDSFTFAQAAIMDGRGRLTKSKSALVENNFFISYIADKKTYSMHNMLREYLLGRFDVPPAAFARKINRRAASACMSVSDYLGAARFFDAAGDFGAVLRLPFTPVYMNEQKEMGVAGFVERFASKCPEDILLRHPFAVLRFAYQFLQNGDRDGFARMTRLLREFLSAGGAAAGGFSEDEMSRLRGELAVLMSFTAYNDIERMSAYHKEALSHFRGRDDAHRTVVFGATPWTFGMTSVLCMFWSKVGELDEELDLMDERLPCYLELSGGHGTGADAAFRAEAALVKGDEGAAEAAGRKARYFAEGAKQNSIVLCADLILGRSAVLRGDLSTAASARDNIAAYALEKRGRGERRMAEMCLAALDLASGLTDNVPAWLRTAEGIRKTLHVQAQSYGLMLYERFLLLEGRHAELYALGDFVAGFARGMNYLLPRLCHLICAAAAKNRDGKSAEAAEYLSAALDMALPDEIYLPFAENGGGIEHLLEAAKNDLERRGEERSAEKIGAILAICERFASGAAKIAARAKAAKPVLTPREREIAALAADGLRTREIARRLCVTDGTVRTALTVIYGKLGISSRMGLTKTDF